MPFVTTSTTMNPIPPLVNTKKERNRIMHVFYLEFCFMVTLNFLFIIIYV